MPVFCFSMMTVLGALCAVAAASAAEPSGPSAPVRLEIYNGTASSELRCQLVLAHFVTQDIGRISAGKSAVIALRRDRDEGVLIYRSGARRMAVENILCGIAGNWRATRNDLNLAALRAGRRAQLKIFCQAPEALSCKARGAED